MIHYPVGFRVIFVHLKSLDTQETISTCWGCKHRTISNRNSNKKQHLRPINQTICQHDVISYLQTLEEAEK
jgi:hypothetical protein